MHSFIRKQGPLGVYTGVMLLALPNLYRAVFRFYSYFVVGGTLFLLSIYLLLPVLRSMGTDNPVRWADGSQLFGIWLDLDVYWYAPILLLLLSAVILSRSTRAELSIWREATAFYKGKILNCLKKGSASQKMYRVANRAAKESGLAFRWSCRLALEATKLAVVTLVFLLFSPPVLLIIIPISGLLGIYFRYSIWIDRPDSPARYEVDAAADKKLLALIEYRMKRANTAHVFSALMPLTLLILILVSKSGISTEFDLADLMFISVLVSTFGTALSSIIQTAIRLRRAGQDVFLVASHASQGDYDKLSRSLQALAGQGAYKGSEDGEGESWL